MSGFLVLFLKFSGEFTFFFPHPLFTERHLSLWFFPFHTYLPKGVDIFLSYSVNQLALHVSGKYIIVAKIVLVSVKKPSVTFY